MVRDQATKGFVNHTEEFGPCAGPAGNRECHGQMVSSVTAADVWRRDLENETREVLMRFETEKSSDDREKWTAESSSVTKHFNLPVD